MLLSTSTDHYSMVPTGCYNRCITHTVLEDIPMTFSIVARDPHRGELGIAVQSKFLAVGAVVPWAKAGIGAIATQSWANTSYGPQGLELLASGFSATETLQQLINADEGRADRQVGIIGPTGTPATY